MSGGASLGVWIAGCDYSGVMPVAFEAKGGRVLGFAYYRKWKPRTYSIHFMRSGAINAAHAYAT